MVQSRAVGELPQEHRFHLDGGADPMLTMPVLWQGLSDPQMRFENGAVLRATRTAAGPASLHIRVVGKEVVVRAWGPGAADALAAAPGMVGNTDDPSLLVPRHNLIAELARRLPGLRLARGGRVIEALVPSILGQKVTSLEARRAHRALLARYGEPAPGPLRLTLPPPPELLARLPYWAFHPLGIERRRAEVIRAAAAVAPRLEEIARLSPDTGMRRLMALPGVGPWTAAETMRLALADPDAVSVGDYHLPGLICWALASERGGTDERMLELLEPYRGQRGRVALLVEHGGLQRTRRGPRMAPRSIAAI
jgi:3-methyladenine DNA glycosylase/8-oxoguanine DNA glycosylase